MAKTTTKLSKESRELSKCTTPEFRVSYPHVFKTNSIAGSTPKYSIVMLFPKTTDITVIKKIIRAAKINKYGAKEKNWPDPLYAPITDGDGPKHDGRDGYANHWAIKASTSEMNKPSVVDQNVQLILDPKEFYGGCYARAHIYAYAWEYMGKEGISFSLEHVQKTRDGKSFSGKKDASAVFEPVNAESNSDELNSEDLQF